MNPGRFYMPNMANMGMRMAPMNGAMMNSAMMGGPMMRGAMSSVPRGMGFFSRIGNSLKSFNFGGLLSGVNKTLNVVNQTIPLIRQAKPMVNNMKSMFRLAKAFGDETVSNNSKNRKINNNFSNSDVHHSNNNVTNSYINENSVIKKEVSDDSYPNFFI